MSINSRPAGRPTVETRRTLDTELVDEVERLLAEAARHDGTRPVSEQAMFRLREHDPAVRSVLSWLPTEAGDESRRVLAGYGQLALEEPPGAAGTEAAGAELVVRPTHRGRGVGGALLDQLVAEANGRPLNVWAHGGQPAAAALARSRGFTRVRELWIMARSLDEAPPEAPLPENVTLRPFRPGQDDEAWLDLNARAFAHHPEQGRWDAGDLSRRVAAPWFDADGFLLAERDGRLAGFHWTKVHPNQPPTGEVYVIGVDPEFQGTGLGRALLVAGLRWLRDHGLTEVILYVESDNAPAVRLYERLGFGRRSADVMYQLAPSETSRARSVGHNIVRRPG